MQSRCTRKFHKSHFVRKFTGKMPRAKTETQTSCDLRNRNAIGDVKRNFVQNKYKKMPRTKSATQTFCASLRSRKCNWKCHKSHFVREFTDRMPRAKSATQTLFEPAQSKCIPEMWKCHTSRFVQAGQTRDTDFARACAVEMHLEMSQEPLCAEIYR